MLIVTPAASTLARDLCARGVVPVGSALRIAPAHDATGDLLVSVVPGPRPGDAVIEVEGAVVLVERETADLLAGTVLDAHLTPAGPDFCLNSPD